MSEERPTSSDGATRPADSDPSPAATNGFLVNNPARTGYDPSVKWWVNYMRIMMGQVTAEGAHHYREDRYRANEQRDVARCQKYRDVLMQKSPLIVFLREKIEALHGKLDGDNVVCRRCPALIRPDGTVARQAGGFSPAHGIVVCSNEVRSRAHLEDTLAHEMVHAWDHLRWKVDWVGEKSLRHAACTEIRAAMLSGECRWTKEFGTRKNYHLTGQLQECVRRRAVMSVMARPSCKDDVHAVRVVNEVWDSCFSDKRPFVEIFR